MNFMKDRQFPDCMVDVETLSTNTDAVITQIGLCFFDANDPNPDDYFATQILLDVEEQKVLGRHVSKGTMKFWEGEDQALFEKVTSGTTSMRDAVTLVRNTWATYAKRGCQFWGNGPSFDETLVRSLFEHFDETVPWAFFKVRCFRTKMQDWPVKRVKPTVKHDGMSDAIAQAQTIKRCYEMQNK